ncbi:MAG: hypothetical protein IPK68_05245 [Bdellovibrionales bacterium]|nr:hypothetical protein [Bdellovibrionales bacterium]
MVRDTNRNHQANLKHLSCPICGKTITRDRIFLQMAVCECGWTSSLRSAHSESQRDSRTATGLVGAAVLLVLGVIHVIQWDSYAVEIALIKGKELAGIAQIADLERKVEICERRGELNCVAATLSKLHLHNSKEIKYTSALALVQSKLGRWSDATLTFADYVKAGGRESEILFEYAKVLATTSKIEMAVTYFDHILESKPGVIQIKVTRAYVNMLMANGRFDQARVIIERVRKLGENAAYFLDDEMREIQRRTNSQRS